MISFFAAGGLPEPGFPEQNEPDAARREPRGRARVFVVEDDVDLRETLVDILRYEGFEVATAANGREALPALRGAAPPDLILLDLMMPVMNGWELRAELLRDPELAGVPVIVLSAVDDLPRQRPLLQAAACLLKPVEVSELLETIRRHCR